jgi:molybdate transport system ATP-binding protein
MLNVRLVRQRGEFALRAAFESPTPGVIALFGRSGCGKSTLVNLIAGLLKPDEGLVELNGEVLFDSARGINVPAEQRRIGYVFQDSRLFPHFNVLGNLRYGQKRAPADSAPSIQLDEIVDLLGLRALLSRRVHRLSGGERQRVALGRALLSRPRLLLLDEPLASLDLARREELLPYLERLRDHLSIPMIYVSHQFEEVLRLATRVVLLDSGSVIAQGDIATISRRAELRAIVGSEAAGAVVEGRIEAVDRDAGIARVRVGESVMSVEADGHREGQRMRIQVLARDVILALEPPRGLSVRNALQGGVVSLQADGKHARLVEVDVGGAIVLARVTAAASEDLNLRVGLTLWVLVKAVSLRGYADLPAVQASAVRPPPIS